MFAPISAIFGLLFLASTLPNGIRVDELPARSDSVEIVVGYAAGGLADLRSTAAGKALIFNAYAAGGDIQSINEVDRTAVRITAPRWAAPMLFDQLPSFFKEIPDGDKGSDPSAPPDFRAKVEQEIREALLGATSTESDYTTGTAFVLSSVGVPKSLLDALAAIPRRGSASGAQQPISRLPAERTLRFKSDLPEGAVIFAAPAPPVYYKEWYLLLLLDRLIHRAVPLPLKTSLPLMVRPYYYRIELPVPAGQFPAAAEESLLQELQRLQLTTPNARDMTAARQDALAYLNSDDVREWFASHGISDRRQEGIQWVESISTDELRAAARDLLIVNHVVASWAAKPKQTSVSVEPLTAPQPSPPGRGQPAKRAGEGNPAAIVVDFPTHTDPPTSTPVPERLSSGVSIVLSTTYAVFVSGGSLTHFDHDPIPYDLKAFTTYRPDRILVLVPPSSVDRARQVWTAFQGTTSGPTGVPKGKVSTGDLPALFILKTILELRVIQSGWSHDVQLRIDATEGSGLQITADDAQRAQILEWIKSIGMTPLSEKYFAWAREVAIHRFRLAEPDLQSLTWERDPQGMILDLSTIGQQHVEDVARIYF